MLDKSESENSKYALNKEQLALESEFSSLMSIHWVAPFLSAQLDHGFTIKRSGSLDYYQQPGMYWIRYEMVQRQQSVFPWQRAGSLH